MIKFSTEPALSRNLAFASHRRADCKTASFRWLSSAMRAIWKKYVGAVNNERGHDFAKSVASTIRAKGWQTKSEGQMTELGGPSELGDIDVLGVAKRGRELALDSVERKRLQLARTVAEISRNLSPLPRRSPQDELAANI